jgi:hypothetical protein
MHHIGPNEICRCGSGKKFKDCHLGRVERSEHSGIEIFSKDLATNESRNLRLLDAIDEIFELRKRKNLKNVRKTITDAKVSELYVTVQRLWPGITDVPQILPEPSEKLRTFFMGDTDPEKLLLEVHRLSLYVDEILIVNPLNPPFTYAEHFNPALHPSKWRSDTLRIVHVLKNLEPFIRSGVVRLIPNPTTFDPLLLDETAQLAAKRIEKRGGINVVMEDFQPSSDRLLLLMLTHLPKEKRLSELKRLFPDKSDIFIKSTLERLEPKLSFSEHVLIPENVPKDEMHVLRTGANLETGLLICGATGAFPSTNLPTRWKEISLEQDQLSEEAQLWAPVSHGISNLKYSFLNEIPTKLVWDIRNDGRLSSFRALLRKLYLEVGSSSSNFTESSIRAFCDEVSHEYNVAEGEWVDIKTSLLKHSITLGTTAIVGGAFQTAVAPIGIVGTGISHVAQFMGKKKAFRKKTPMSVFLDIKSHGDMNRTISNIMF